MTQSYAHMIWHLRQTPVLSHPHIQSHVLHVLASVAVEQVLSSGVLLAVVLSGGPVSVQLCGHP